MMAALATGAFMVAGISAWLVLKDRGVAVAERTLKLALGAGLSASILVTFPTGDAQARQVAATQPEKFASIEGLVHTQTHAPLVVFGVPIPLPEGLQARIEVPSILSFMAFGNTAAEVKGRDHYAPDALPPMWLTFLSFHNMVVLGGIMILLTALAALQLKRKRLLTSRRLLWALVVATPIPLIACQLGWITAEVGRQPWIVYHLLKTADAISVTVSSGMIALSLFLLGLVSALLGAAYLFLLSREIKHGPVLVEPREVA
jgi:cytochrome d ubiquinol oxidase subunit I